MENITKGAEYEKQIKFHIINTTNNNAYLWDEVPETVLIKNKIVSSHKFMSMMRKENKINPVADTGIDIIQVNDDKTCTFVQCKNGYKNGVTVHDLAGFYSWIASTNNNGVVYYTSKLSRNITEKPVTDRIKYIKHEFVENDKQIIDVTFENITPHPHQIEAVDKFNECFENRGILSMPCGTGKTYICYLCSRNYNQIVIVSPLIQSAQQNLERFVQYGYEHNTMHVHSCGSRDIDEITNFIVKNEKFVISSTYDSIDVIQQLSHLLQNALFIVDEFHNLSRKSVLGVDCDDYDCENECDYDDIDMTVKNDDNNDIDYDDEDDDSCYDNNDSDEIENKSDNTEEKTKKENNAFYNLLNSNHKILFVSATPRVYELENECDQQTIDELFGPIIYNMSFDTAIKEKYICDYNVWLPSIHENNDDLMNELSVYDVEVNLKNKCVYFFSCLLNYKPQKCIVYCSSINEIEQMTNAMILLNNEYCLEFDVQQITSNDNSNVRKRVLCDFENNEKMQLLFSVRILDECIDIPSCDSIFITHHTKNETRTIQRLCRCLRIDKNNKNKIGNVFIWCDEYDTMTQTFSALKECDAFFTTKVHVNENNYYSVNETQRIDTLKHDEETVNDFVVGVKKLVLSSWWDKFKLLELFVEQHKRRPTRKDDKFLNSWWRVQNQNYKKRKYAMKNDTIKKAWEEFIEKNKELFLDRYELWFKNLNKLNLFVEQNNIFPTETDDKYLNSWLRTQNQNYKEDKQIMNTNEIVKKAWEEFKEKNKELFLDRYDLWFKNLNKLNLFVEQNNRFPTEKDDKFLKSWLSHQIQYYKKDKSIINTNENVKKAWEEFKEKNKELFLDRCDLWFNNLNKLNLFVEQNKSFPNETDDKFLNKWLGTQLYNYKKGKYAMKNDTIKKAWEEFKENNKELFLDNCDLWFENLNKLNLFVEQNGRFPNETDDKFLNSWLRTQIQTYKKGKYAMKNDTIKKAWEKFKEKNEELFLDNCDLWFKNLNKLNLFVEQNNRFPTNKDDKFLNNWLGTQKKNYKNYKKDKNIMNTNEFVKKAWEEFKEKNEELFLDDCELWFKNLNKLNSFVEQNKSFPTKKDDKYLNCWWIHQNKNYKKDKGIINTNENVKKAWEEFKERNEELFLDNYELWFENLNKLNLFIEQNNRFPTKKNYKFLNSWLKTQIHNYKKEKYAMKNDTIRKTWDEFTENNKELFKQRNLNKEMLNTKT